MCFFIEPVHTAIPRNYHKSRICDLEERVPLLVEGTLKRIHVTYTTDYCVAIREIT